MSRGFSLVEIIVSLFLISVMLLLLQAVIQSGVLVRTSRNQGIALSIARNELENLRGDGYTALPSSGSFPNILLSTLPLAATTTRIVSVYNTETKQVTVSVLWKDPGMTASSTVSLSTLITKTGGLP